MAGHQLELSIRLQLEVIQVTFQCCHNDGDGDDDGGDVDAEMVCEHLQIDGVHEDVLQVFTSAEEASRQIPRLTGRYF